MKKSLLILALAATIGQVSAQSAPWTKIAADKARGLQRIREVAASEESNLYQFNATALKQTLQNAHDRFSGQPGVEIAVPNMQGKLERFLVWENSNFAPELQAQFPEIRAYAGRGISDPKATINFSLSPSGIQTMVLRADSGSEFIEPFTTDHSVYVIFNSQSRTVRRLPLVCTTQDVALADELGRNASTQLSNTGNYKTMRLALSCTAEYTTYFGGTVAGALAAMNATMARCNGVFEKDLAIHLNLIANNNVLIYTNAATDPYSDADEMGNWNSELQSNLTATIGAANYDIGHLFGATGGGGNAGCIGCVCGASKGSGITSPADGIPQGDNFDIDYVAHEMGHQMGANHCFSIGSGFAEDNAVNVEPGSASSIMGYAGITEADVQPHSDDYFGYRSILQIQANIATKLCPVTVTATNATPTVDAGADYTIPKGTAFKLTGTGADANSGNTLTYSWEENDDASVPAAYTTALTASFPSATKTNGPNFRSLPAKSNGVRYMPDFATVLGGSVSNTWEVTSTVARTLNFTLTVRDNAGTHPQTNTDAMVVTVNGTAGPFAVTYPNTVNESWTQGTSKTVTWNVAGTTANNINTSNVNILFSSDGGATFTTLVANTANDGSETITVPNVSAPYCRILIEPVGNIYYAVSKSFAIGYSISTSCNTYNSTAALPVPDGTGQNLPGSTVTSTINVPATGNISDVNVGLNVSHTWPNDLVLSVKHPDNTAVAVWNRACAGNDNFNITVNDGSGAFSCVANMTGTFAPSQPLAAFNGKPANGNWTLSATDWYADDTGTVNSWSLTICADNPQLSTAAVGLADFSLYPNPNSGNFTVQFTPSGSSDIAVYVHDIRGRQIYQKNYANEGFFAKNIQLSQVQSGVYLVTVQEGDRKEVRKIVVR